MTRTVGQFSIKKWAGGWSATAQISPNERQSFCSDTEAGAVAHALRAHARGIVPMCAIPEEEYHADIQAQRKVICSRCGQKMECKEHAEGCEDNCCPLT